MAALVFGLADKFVTRGIAKVIARRPLAADQEIEAMRLRRIGWLLAAMPLVLSIVAGGLVVRLWIA